MTVQKTSNPDRSKRMVRAALWLATFTLVPAAFAADDRDITGAWEVTTKYAGGLPSVAGIEISREGDNYKGKSGWLVPSWATFEYTGTREKDGVHLTVTFPGGFKIGELVLGTKRGALEGAGTLHGVPVTLVGRRPRARPPNDPRVRDFAPTFFYRTLSGATPPALRIYTGDTVRTKTVDAGGVDENDKPRAMAGNNVTGPFYIEGAMPGDTLAVHFNRIRPNRKWAFQARAAIQSNVMPPGVVQAPI